MKNLYNLRSFFIIYFLIKIVIDIILGSQGTGAAGYMNISPVVFYIAGIILNLVIFLLGLLIFKFLLEKRNWARILLLVIGWLAVLDFFSSLFISPKIAELSHNIAPLNEWESLLLVDRITDFIGLIFWGYSIIVLQFTDEIKKIFRQSSTELPQDQNL